MQFAESSRQQNLRFSNGESSPGGSRIVLGPETQRARQTSARRLSQRSSSSSTSALRSGELSPGLSEQDKPRPSLWRRVIGVCGEEMEVPVLGEDISGPTDVRHNYHGTFDSAKMRFKGLPTEWNQQANVFHKQFGVPLRSVPRVEVDGYAARLPAVLVVLKQELIERDGLRQEGVFRVSANKSTQDLYRRQLDEGRFQGCQTRDDAMCMASLIKEWFRGLPEPLLNCLPRETIMETPKAKNPTAAVSKLLLQLPEPNQSVFLWLLDLLGETSQYERENRMSVKALSIVLAPNLYTVPDGSSPMEMVALMDAAVNTVQTCLEERITGDLATMT